MRQPEQYEQRGTPAIAAQGWPRVAVIVLNWNRWRDTVACLESLQKITYPNVRITLVDNGSDADDVMHLRAWANTVKMLRNNQNLGFAGGNNTGIRDALQDPATSYVLILNNDTVVEPEFLTEMVQAARAQHADMISPRVLGFSDRHTVDRFGIVLTRALLGYDMKLWEGRDPFCPSGCCALYSRRLLEDVRVGEEYFDEDFFCYSEDVDLGIRAVLLGYHAAAAHDAIVYHKASASTSPESAFSLYHGHRNTIWYLAKSAPGSALLRHGLWIFLGQLLPVISNIFRGRGLLILRAKAAGVRGMPRMLSKRRLAYEGRKLYPSMLEASLYPRPFYMFRTRVTRLLANLRAVRPGDPAH